MATNGYLIDESATNYKEVDSCNLQATNTVDNSTVPTNMDHALTDSKNESSENDTEETSSKTKVKKSSKAKKKRKTKKKESLVTSDTNDSSLQTISEASSLPLQAKKLKKRPKVTRMLVDTDGAIEHKLEQKYMELESLIKRQFVEKKSNLSHQHIGQMEMLRQQYNLSCHGLPPTGPFSKPIRSKQRPHSAHVYVPSDSDEAYGTIRTLQNTSKYRKPRSQTRCKSAKSRRETCSDSENHRHQRIDINVETDSLGSARDHTPRAPRLNSIDRGSRRSLRSRSMGSPSPTSSPERSGYMPTDHKLKTTDNAKIKEWLQKKNVLLRKEKAKDRAEKREKRQESMLRESAKDVERETGKEQVKEWMLRKRREALQLAKEEKARQKDLEKQQREEKERKQMHDVQGKSWMRPVSAPACRTSNKSSTETSTSTDTDNPASCSIPHPPNSKRMYKRAPAGRVRLTVKSKDGTEGSAEGVDKSLEESQLSYTEWLKRKQEGDKKKQAVAEAAKTQTEVDPDLQEVFPELHKKRITRVLNYKKTLDTGLNKADEESASDQKSFAKPEDSTSLSFQVDGSKASLSSRNSYTRPQSAIIKPPTPQPCKSPKRPRSAHPRVESIMQEGEGDETQAENPFRLPFPSNLGLPTEVAKAQAKIFPDRVAEERQSLEAPRLEPQGCDDDNQPPTSPDDGEEEPEAVEEEKGDSDQKEDETELKVGAAFFTDSLEETPRPEATEPQETTEKEDAATKMDNQYFLDDGTEKREPDKNVEELDQVNVTELPSEKIPVISEQSKQEDSPEEVEEDFQYSDDSDESDDNNDEDEDEEGEDAKEEVENEDQSEEEEETVEEVKRHQAEDIMETEKEIPIAGLSQDQTISERPAEADQVQMVPEVHDEITSSGGDGPKAEDSILEDAKPADVDSSQLQGLQGTPEDEELNNKEQRLQENEQLDIEEQRLQEPVIEEQGLQEPVIEEQGLQEPDIEEQVLQEPVIEEQGLQEPVIEEQGLQELVIEEQGLQEPVIEEQVLQEPDTEEQGVQEPDTEEQGLQEPVIEEQGLSEDTPQHFLEEGSEKHEPDKEDEHEKSLLEQVVDSLADVEDETSDVGSIQEEQTGSEHQQPTDIDHQEVNSIGYSAEDAIQTTEKTEEIQQPNTTGIAESKQDKDIGNSGAGQICESKPKDGNKDVTFDSVELRKYVLDNFDASQKQNNDEKELEDDQVSEEIEEDLNEIPETETKISEASKDEGEGMVTPGLVVTANSPVEPSTEVELESHLPVSVDEDLTLSVAIADDPASSTNNSLTSLDTDDPATLSKQPPVPHDETAASVVEVLETFQKEKDVDYSSLQFSTEEQETVTEEQRTVTDEQQTNFEEEHKISSKDTPADPEEKLEGTEDHPKSIEDQQTSTVELTTCTEEQHPCTQEEQTVPEEQHIGTDEQQEEKVTKEEVNTAADGSQSGTEEQPSCTEDQQEEEVTKEEETAVDDEPTGTEEQKTVTEEQATGTGEEQTGSEELQSGTEQHQRKIGLQINSVTPQSAITSDITESEGVEIEQEEENKPLESLAGIIKSGQAMNKLEIEESDYVNVPQIQVQEGRELGDETAKEAEVKESLQEDEHKQDCSPEVTEKAQVADYIHDLIKNAQEETERGDQKTRDGEAKDSIPEDHNGKDTVSESTVKGQVADYVNVLVNHADDETELQDQTFRNDEIEDVSKEESEPECTETLEVSGDDVGSQDILPESQDELCERDQTQTDLEGGVLNGDELTQESQESDEITKDAADETAEPMHQSPNEYIEQPKVEPVGTQNQDLNGRGSEEKQRNADESDDDSYQLQLRLRRLQSNEDFTSEIAYSSRNLNELDTSFDAPKMSAEEEETSDTSFELPKMSEEKSSEEEEGQDTSDRTAELLEERLSEDEDVNNNKVSVECPPAAVVSTVDMNLPLDDTSNQQLDEHSTKTVNTVPAAIGENGELDSSLEAEVPNSMTSEANGTDLAEDGQNRKTLQTPSSIDDESFLEIDQHKSKIREIIPATNDLEDVQDRQKGTTVGQIVGESFDPKLKSILLEGEPGDTGADRQQATTTPRKKVSFSGRQVFIQSDGTHEISRRRRKPTQDVEAEDTSDGEPTNAQLLMS